MATFPSPSVASPHPISTLRRFCFLKMRSALALRAARRNGAEMRFKVGSGTITKLVILKKNNVQNITKNYEILKIEQNITECPHKRSTNNPAFEMDAPSSRIYRQKSTLRSIENHFQQFQQTIQRKNKKQHISIAYNSPVNFWPWGYSTGDRKWMMWMIINDMHPLFYDFR